MPASVTQPSGPVAARHDVESEVRRELLSTPGVNVSSLVVRRLPNGVCLQGILRFDSQEVDICDSIRRVPGVSHILNQMVVCQQQSLLSDADGSSAR